MESTHLHCAGAHATRTSSVRREIASGNAADFLHSDAPTSRTPPQRVVSRLCPSPPAVFNNSTYAL
jgi:hypothetical protein